MRALIVVCWLACIGSVSWAQAPTQSSDSAQVGLILDNFEQAYQKRDAAQWARYFAADADFMQAFGRYWKGRAGIERFMSMFISHQSDAMQAREISRRIAFPASDVAFAELTEEISGIREAEGGVSGGSGGVRVGAHRSQYCD